MNSRNSKGAYPPWGEKFAKILVKYLTFIKILKSDTLKGFASKKKFLVRPLVGLDMQGRRPINYDFKNFFSVEN